MLPIQTLNNNMVQVIEQVSETQKMDAVNLFFLTLFLVLSVILVCVMGYVAFDSYKEK